LQLVDVKGHSRFIPGKVRIVVGGSSPSKKNEELGAAKSSEATLTLK